MIDQYACYIWAWILWASCKFLACGFSPELGVIGEKEIFQYPEIWRCFNGITVIQNVRTSRGLESTAQELCNELLLVMIGSVLAYIYTFQNTSFSAFKKPLFWPDNPILQQLLRLRLQPKQYRRADGHTCGYATAISDVFTFYFGFLLIKILLLPYRAHIPTGETPSVTRFVSYS